MLNSKNRKKNRISRRKWKKRTIIITITTIIQVNRMVHRIFLKPIEILLTISWLKGRFKSRAKWIRSLRVIGMSSFNWRHLSKSKSVQFVWMILNTMIKLEKQNATICSMRNVSTNGFSSTSAAQCVIKTSLDMRYFFRDLKSLWLCNKGENYWIFSYEVCE